MIYMWFTGINYSYKLAVEKDRDSIFTTIATIWKPGLWVIYGVPQESLCMLSCSVNKFSFVDPNREIFHHVPLFPQLTFPPF
jgi:hypothetical protein